MALVSVIMPVYNVEAYVAQAIQSVLQQTYAYLELILVDDGATDRSLAICQGFDDPRIRIIRQANRGLAGARNTGIRHARGAYIALIDSDDLWAKTKLAQHVAHLEQAPQIGVSYCPSAFIDEAGQPLGLFQTPKLTAITAVDILCRNPIGNGSVPVLRREVFEAIAFQENRYGQMEEFYFDDQFRQSEDIECWLRIALMTRWGFEGVPEVLTQYRVNTGGLSASIPRQLAAWERVIEKTRAYAPDFLAQWEGLARAYQLRYLARRAVRLGDAAQAVALVHQALATDLRILWQEPKRTVTTLAASYLLALLPYGWYQQLEKLAINRSAKPVASLQGQESV